MTESSKATQGTSSQNSTFWFPATKIGDKDVKCRLGQASQVEVVRTKMGFDFYGIEIDGDYEGMDLLGSFETNRKWFRQHYTERDGTKKVNKYTVDKSGDTLTIDFLEEPSEPPNPLEEEGKFRKQGFRNFFEDGVKSETLWADQPSDTAQSEGPVRRSAK